MSAPTRVVVVGGSVAGLATALFCARGGSTVVVIDQDAMATGSADEPRRATPQAAHSHIFLARFRSLLLERAPDVLHALLDGGAREIDLRAARFAGAPDANGLESSDDLIALACRRSVLESVVRHHVMDEPGVEIRTGVAVRGVSIDQEVHPPLVRGVRLEDGSLVEGDVVVDASGRRSPFPGWLAEAGIDVPVEVVDCGITYVSRFFRLRPGATPPPLNRGFTSGASFDRYSCLVFPGDNDTFSITFGTLPEDRDLRPLGEAAAFDRAVAAIPSLAWWADEQNVEPISAVRSMTGLKNRLRRYVVDGEPVVLGLAAVGDAISTTNPAHSRGTTLAFVHAAAVADAIAAHGSDMECLAGALDAAIDAGLAPWFDDSVEQDMIRLSRWRPGGEQCAAVSGPAPSERLTNGELYTVAQVDADVWHHFARLQNLIDSPDDVLGDARVAAAVRSRLADGVRLPIAVAPSHDELAELLREELVATGRYGLHRRRGRMTTSALRAS